MCAGHAAVQFGAAPGGSVAGPTARRQLVSACAEPRDLARGDRRARPPRRGAHGDPRRREHGRWLVCSSRLGHGARHDGRDGRAPQ